MTPITSIGLAPNPRKPEAVKLTTELTGWLETKGVRVLLTQEIAQLVHKSRIGVSEEEMATADLLVVLGGDGTLLRWNRLTAPMGTPVIGVNFGHYGFITEVAPEAAKAALEKVLSGDYSVSERVLLKAQVSRGDEIVGSYLGLNDIVVSKGPLARILNWHTYVDDKFIVTHAADGMIVATPTGSTAYSLSAGGPVIHPDVSVLTITPICPHTLSGRTLVVPDSERIRIVGESNGEAGEMMLTVDGQLGEHMKDDDTVEVRKAEFKSRLVQVEPDSFYSKLKTRLRWGERS